ncbi:MAG: hypothetical protein ACOYJ1_08200 [Peptococcales bacterium]|jgi:hypothetical protein
MINNKITQRDITIIGGKIPIEELSKFLEDLRMHMPWSICEYTYGSEILKDALPEIKFLERLRKFGSEGDLDIRRDGSHYQWRFVGLPYCRIEEQYNPQDFWKNQEEIKHLREHNDELILYGTVEKGIFIEKKVARAKLNYPLETEGIEKAIIKAKLYTYYGRPQFAWYQALEGR